MLFLRQKKTLGIGALGYPKSYGAWPDFGSGLPRWLLGRVESRRLWLKNEVKRPSCRFAHEMRSMCFCGWGGRVGRRSQINRDGLSPFGLAPI